MTFSWAIGLLIKFIRDPLAKEEDGYKIVALFIGLMLLCMVTRSRTIHNGFILGFRIRRVLVSALYDKVGRLSVKSISSVNSGKLISLVSSDLYQIEKQLGLSPALFAAPFINIYAFTLIYTILGWEKTLIILGFQILVQLVQRCSGKISRPLRFGESQINDKRLKLVNDMVVGSRTIKCYGWEKTFIEKILDLRNQQLK
jgi:ABC-type multidrug transport system fused ATPase/permease subunit